MSELSEIREALVLRPGDTLIVLLDQRATDAQAKMMKERLYELIPDVQHVVLTGLQLAGVRRSP